MNVEILTLRRDSVELESILFKGSVVRYGERWTAIPREIVPHPQGHESIVFEVVPAHERVGPSFWKICFQAIRPRSLTLSVSPALAILSLGLSRGWEFHLWVGSLAFLGVLFLHISANLFNDVEDHLRLVDIPSSMAATVGGSGVIQKGWMSARQMKRLAQIALGLGAVLGLPALAASFARSPILLGVACLAFIGVLTHSNRPVGMKYRALGNLWIFFLSGPLLTVGISQAFFNTQDSSIGLIGIFFGLLSWAVARSKKLMRFEPSRLGFEGSRWFLLLLYGISFAVLWGGGLMGVFPGAVIGFSALGLIPIFFRVKRVFRASGPISPLLVPIERDALQIHWICGALVSIAFLFKLFFDTEEAGFL